MSKTAISLNICSEMVESAARSCQQILPEQAPPPNPNWDAMAASFASLSNAFAWGSIILALVAVFAAFTWGKIVTARAEREAREMAQAEVEKWLANVAPPLIAREASEFLRTFRAEATTSDEDLANLVAAAGNDGVEGEDGKK